MAYDNWTKQKAYTSQKCCNCEGEIKKEEEYMDHRWREEDGHKGKGYWEGNKYCLSCYENKKQEQKNTKEKVNQEKLDKFNVFDNECMEEALFIGPRLENNIFELTDYKKVKDLQKRLKSQNNRQKNEFIEGRKKDLEELLQFLENKFPERTKLKYNRPKDRRGREKNNCYHENIHLDEVAYCLKCGEDESQSFLSKLKQLYRKNLDNWIKKHNLNSKKTLGIIINELSRDFTNQAELKQAYQQIVKELNELARSKGITDLIEVSDNNHKNSIITQKDKDINSNLKMESRERERERESNLEPKSNHLIYWGLGIIGVSLIGLLGFLIIRKNK